MAHHNRLEWVLSRRRGSARNSERPESRGLVVIPIAVSRVARTRSARDIFRQSTEVARWRASRFPVRSPPVRFLCGLPYQPSLASINHLRPRTRRPQTVIEPVRTERFVPLARPRRLMRWSARAPVLTDHSCMSHPRAAVAPSPPPSRAPRPDCRTLSSGPDPRRPRGEAPSLAHA